MLSSVQNCHAYGDSCTRVRTLPWEILVEDVGEEEGEDGEEGERGEVMQVPGLGGLLANAALATLGKVAFHTGADLNECD